MPGSEISHVVMGMEYDWSEQGLGHHCQGFSWSWNSHLMKLLRFPGAEFLHCSGLFISIFSLLQLIEFWQIHLKQSRAVSGVRILAPVKSRSPEFLNEAGFPVHWTCFNLICIDAFLTVSTDFHVQGFNLPASLPSFTANAIAKQTKQSRCHFIPRPLCVQESHPHLDLCVCIVAAK